ncbi:uncharacterized protein MKK02DRAFT_29335 [Dioszegia hungarica]|uniref:Uncharacterized protein n=1 Tax=Dioszegia hungarica TaxID=4972 RepID=A0AA38HFL1_9TREE|nr:uncharacterized protein MKK02DRAFT_29335 [Dioszegia hungarica]KAI9639232.1 hypothetical protein MKK02DRAFT_29335 [Dioszegia hungarica]
MSFAGLHAHNYSLFAIPAGWVLAMVPHFYAIGLYNKERAPGTAEWDNMLPYANRSEGLKNAKISPYMAQRFLRAEAANDNSHTILPYFAAAVLAGNYARLTPRFLNNTVLFFFAARGAYIYFYINGTTPLMSKLRSVSYVASIVACMTLFSQAGRVLY